MADDEKTINEWFYNLNNSVRAKALKNMDDQLISGEQKCKSLREAINGAFTWSRTPEGAQYWSELYGRVLDSPDSINQS